MSAENNHKRKDKYGSLLTIAYHRNDHRIFTDRKNCIFTDGKVPMCRKRPFTNISKFF